MTYASQATKRMRVIGVTANWGQTNFIPMEAGRVFTEAEVDRRRTVVVLGNAPARVALPRRRSDRQAHPRGQTRVHGRRRLRQAAQPARRHGVRRVRRRPVDDLAEGLRRRRACASSASSTATSASSSMPREDVTQDDGDARGRGDHAGAPRPAARSGERLRHRHAGRRCSSSGSGSAAPSSWRSSSSRRSR